MKTFLLCAAAMAAIALTPVAARAQATSPSNTNGPTLTASRAGLTAPVGVVPTASAEALMGERRRGHAPGVSLIVVGAIGMLAGLLIPNHNILWIGTVVTAVGLVIYLF
jgi:hypothetical protein